MQSFLWHDYETFGTSPRLERPAQFAAIRTDAGLNEIGEPMEWFCKPALDYLPDPRACLVTGITPQEALRKGLVEAEFASRIEQAFAPEGTIGVGYNSIRFDDEFTRYLFWRNLIDPYAREWRNGNGRWDLVDVMRMAYALRPAGIEWPQGSDGRTSFRLELLTKANGLTHDAAHDALSDVRATIALARLLKSAQPRLFEFALRLRSKQAVRQELGMAAGAQGHAFVHISSMFAVERGCMAVMWPLTTVAGNGNQVIAWDLACDPRELLTLDAAGLRQRLFTPASEMPAGVTRLPVKTVHLNKSPMVAGNLGVLTPAVQQRWGIDMAVIGRHTEFARQLPGLFELFQEALAKPPQARLPPEQDLYSAFVPDADRSRLMQLRRMPVEQWRTHPLSFEDDRLDELVFLYRARNYPDTLDSDEQQRWERHRKARLIDGEGGVRTAAQMMEGIDAASEDESENEASQELLGALYDWADAITPEA